MHVAISKKNVKKIACNCGRTYTPSLEDVGSYLALFWLPTRADGKCGKPLVAISNSPVVPGTTLVLSL